VPAPSSPASTQLSDANQLQQLPESEEVFLTSTRRCYNCNGCYWLSPVRSNMRDCSPIPPETLPGPQPVSMMQPVCNTIQLLTSGPHQAVTSSQLSCLVDILDCRSHGRSQCAFRTLQTAAAIHHFVLSVRSVINRSSNVFISSSCPSKPEVVSQDFRTTYLLQSAHKVQLQHSSTLLRVSQHGDHNLPQALHGDLW
jgi:hypothetical protein